MKEILKAVRWVIASLLLILLFVTVLITPAVTSVTTLLTDRENIIGWIDSSGLYDQTDKLTILILGLTNDFTDEPEYAQEQSKIKEVLKDVLTPGFSRELIEGGINSTYDYLEGRSEKVQISMREGIVEDTLVKIFDNFSDSNLSSIDDLRKLPTCTPDQAKELEETSNIGEITLTCIPESVDLDTITEDLLKEFGIKQEKETPAIVQLIPTNFEFSNAQAAALKGGYKIVRITPIVLFSLISMLTLLCALLIPHRNRITIPSIAAISASCFALTASILLLLSKSVATFILSIIEIPYITDFTGLKTFIEVVVKDLAYRSIWISCGLILLYLLLILAEKVYAKRLK